MILTRCQRRPLAQNLPHVLDKSAEASNFPAKLSPGKVDLFGVCQLVPLLSVVSQPRICHYA